MVPSLKKGWLTAEFMWLPDKQTAKKTILARQGLGLGAPPTRTRLFLVWPKHISRIASYGRSRKSVTFICWEESIILGHKSSFQVLKIQSYLTHVRHHLATHITLEECLCTCETISANCDDT